MESRKGKEDGKGRNQGGHMCWAASKCEMSTGSHMKVSGDRVTKNGLGNHFGFPCSFWGAVNQLLRDAPVSRFTDNPL